MTLWQNCPRVAWKLFYRGLLIWRVLPWHSRDRGITLQGWRNPPELWMWHNISSPWSGAELMLWQTQGGVKVLLPLVFGCWFGCCCITVLIAAQQLLSSLSLCVFSFVDLWIFRAGVFVVVFHLLHNRLNVLALLCSRGSCNLVF